MSDLVITPIVCGAYQANAYLLYRSGRLDALLIDPGDDYPALARAIAASGKRLTDILLTHGHFDHFLCAARLRQEFGARIHIHESDAYLLASREDSAWSAQVCTEPFTPARPDETYPENGEIDVCGVHFKVLHTPGHTQGGVCLLDEADGALFSGDTVFAQGYGRYDLAGGSLHQLLGSLRLILSLDRSLRVYPGHGESAALAQIARYFGK